MKRLVRRNNLPLTLAAAFSILMLAALVAVLVVRAHDQRTINEKICRVAVDSRLALRTIVIASKNQALASTPRSNKLQRGRIKGFYRPLLSLAPPVDCKDGEPVARGG